MKIERIATSDLKLPSGIRVIYELLRIDGQIVENRVIISGLDIANAVLIPIKPEDYPIVALTYNIRVSDMIVTPVKQLPNKPLTVVDLKERLAGVPDDAWVYVCQSMDGTNTDESQALGVYIEDDYVLLYDA